MISVALTLIALVGFALAQILKGSLWVANYDHIRSVSRMLGAEAVFFGFSVNVGHFIRAQVGVPSSDTSGVIAGVVLAAMSTVGLYAASVVSMRMAHQAYPEDLWPPSLPVRVAQIATWTSGLLFILSSLYLAARPL